MKSFPSEIKKVLVIGLGYRTGLHVCNYLSGHGANVTASDTKSETELADTLKNINPAVRILAGKQTPDILNDGFDLVVLSPGVPARIPLVSDAVRRGIPVISEIELASRISSGGIIAITGTDGKSTTTSLTGHILRETGMDARVGGNIGIPFISFVDELHDDSVSVLELSSYQLETITGFRPDVCAIMNITPDHLDRYDGMAAYADAKFRITMNQTPADSFVYRYPDSLIEPRLDRVKAEKRAFSQEPGRGDAWLDDGVIYLRDAGIVKPVLETGAMRIVGVHNAENAMASILMVTSYMKKRGITPDYAAIASACCSFPGLPHRMEVLGEFRGRTVINDSKATTVGAVEMAIRSIKGRGILILGGRTKGDDYSRLANSFGDRIRGLVLIGESRDRFAEIFSSWNCRKAGSLDEALLSAVEMSEQGDAILLSPACASFDMFKSFEQRGDLFRESFDRLVRGQLGV